MWNCSEYRRIGLENWNEYDFVCVNWCNCVVEKRILIREMMVEWYMIYEFILCYDDREVCDIWIYSGIC